MWTGRATTSASQTQERPQPEQERPHGRLAPHTSGGSRVEEEEEGLNQRGCHPVLARVHVAEDHEVAVEGPSGPGDGATAPANPPAGESPTWPPPPWSSVEVQPHARRKVVARAAKLVALILYMAPQLHTSQTPSVQPGTATQWMQMQGVCPGLHVVAAASPGHMLKGCPSQVLTEPLHRNPPGEFQLSDRQSLM